MHGTTKALATLVTVGIGLFSQIGCQDTVMAPGAGRADPIAGANYPRVTALEGLDRYLVFSHPNVTRGQEQPMSVRVPVRAQTDQELNIQYRFEFFDATGRPLAPGMGWRYLRLPARAQRFLEGDSLDTGAADWRLEVRVAR